LTSIEITFFQEKAAGYTLFDHKRTEEILVQLNAEPVDEKLGRYKSKWLRHVTIMNNIRMLKIMLNYRPNRRRLLGKTFEETVRRGRKRPVKS